MYTFANRMRKTYIKFFKCTMVTGINKIVVFYPLPPRSSGSSFLKRGQVIV